MTTHAANINLLNINIKMGMMQNIVDRNMCYSISLIDIFWI